jgi:hypothetical protein
MGGIVQRVTILAAAVFRPFTRTPRSRAPEGVFARQMVAEPLSFIEFTSTRVKDFESPEPPSPRPTGFLTV